MKYNILLVLGLISLFTCRQTNHVKFYHNALKLENSVSFNPNETKLSLQATRDLDKKESFVLVTKEYVISGCTFFPFKDVIEKLLFEYCKQKLTYPSDVIVPSYSLVYKLLYYRYGNKEKIRRYFRDKLNNDYESEFFKFVLKKEEKEFMQVIHEQRISNEFSYTKDEISFAKEMGVSLGKLEISMEIFEFVKLNVDKLNTELKLLLKEFIEQDDAFKLYADYILRKGVSVDIIEYGNVFTSEINEKEYLSYHKNISSNNRMCVILLPVMDLMDHIRVEEGSVEDSVVTVNVSIRPEVGVNFSLDKKFKTNATLGYSYNHYESIQSKENLYVEHNIYDEHLRHEEVTLPYEFNKENFSSLRASVCYLFGCGGFNINFFMSNPSVRIIGHNFHVNKEQLNRSLLNVIKLSLIDESVLKLDVHPLLFEKNAKFSYQIEKKSLVEYINLVKNKLKSFDNIPKSETNLTKVKENLLRIAIDKMHLYYNQLLIAEKEYESLVKKELSKLKEKFFA